jgi:hypothetical protein
LEDLDLEGKIILEGILNKYDGVSWTIYFWPRLGKIYRLL